MRRISIEDLREEMHDIHMVHHACLVWRMRCLSHRLIEFGWEESVKRLSVVEALTLAALVPPIMHDELVRAARLVADERWKAFIDRIAPRFAAAEEAVAV